MPGSAVLATQSAVGARAGLWVCQILCWCIPWAGHAGVTIGFLEQVRTALDAACTHIHELGGGGVARVCVAEEMAFG